MQLPWKAAEVMHWQIGEVEMAQRANVPVFHLAKTGNASALPRPSMLPEARRTSNIWPPSDPSAASPYTHNHSLPQGAQPILQPLSPTQLCLRYNTDDGHAPLRRHADSARPLENFHRPSCTLLPPLGEVTGMCSRHKRYNLPPVITSTEGRRDCRWKEFLPVLPA